MNRPSQKFLGLDALYNLKHNTLPYFHELQNIYGDAVPVRLGHKICWFLFHPDHVEAVLAKEASSFIRYKRIMNLLRQWNGSSLLIEEGASWQQRRRKAMPAFKQQRMPDYFGKIKGYAEEQARLLSVDSAKAINIDHEMAKYALDIAGLTLFSQKLSDQSADVVDAVKTLSEVAYKETTTALPLPDFLPISSKKKKKKAVLLLKAAIRKIVDEKLTHNEDTADLLSILVEHHDEVAPAIQDDVMSLLIAGHETSGATLAWIFILLAANPEVLKNVHNEIDVLLEGRGLTYESLKEFEYLNAVVMEVMRLYPAAYALFCREAVNDVVIGDVTIRNRDLVQLVPYVTHRDGRFFDTPDVFKPERFLERQKHQKYAYFPFGAGPRVCIGQSFAMMEIAITVICFLRDLTLDAIEETPDAIPEFSLRPDKSVNLCFRKR